MKESHLLAKIKGLAQFPTAVFAEVFICLTLLTSAPSLTLYQWGKFWFVCHWWRIKVRTGDDSALLLRPLVRLPSWLAQMFLKLINIIRWRWNQSEMAIKLSNALYSSANLNNNINLCLKKITNYECFMEVAEMHGCIQKRRHLTCCLAALSGIDFVGSVTINDLSRTERRLVITKQIFHYYNSLFSLEKTSEVENIGQKLTTFIYDGLT